MKKKIFYIVLFVLFSSLFTVHVFNLIEDRKKAHLQAENQLIQVTYNTVIEAFRVHSQIVFDNIINTQEVKKILAPLSTATKEQKNKIRTQLYNKLLNTYSNSKSFQLKQLHFHLKNNESFLRFHRPEKFGDNLTNIRKTVEYVNKYKKPIYGFEEGRIFNGYRFVYPLFYKNEYLGSVETSISMGSIVAEIKRTFQGDADFIIDESVVNRTVFQSEKSNYRVCKSFPGYYHEKSISLEGSPLIESLITKYIQNHSFSKDKKNNQPFSFSSQAGENNYITTFLPIKGAITEDTVAYIIVANKYNEYLKYQTQYFQFLTICILLIACVIYFVYRIDNAKQKLTYQNDILKEIQKIGRIGYWEHDLLSNTLHCSEGMLEILGIDTKESKLSYEKFLTNIHPNDLQRVQQTYAESLENKKDYCLEYKIISKMGLTKYVSVDASHTVDSNGVVTQSLGTIHDISTIKIYQKEIENSQKHFKSLVSHIPDIIYKCKNDEDFTMIYLNDSIFTITGYTQAELVENQKLSFASIIYPDDLDEIINTFHNIIFNKHKKALLEYRIITKNSDIIWVKDSFEIVKEGNNVYIEGIISDITAQKVAYSKLQKFIDTQENIVILTNGQELNFGNKSFFDFFGYQNIKDFKKEHQSISEYFICDDRFFHLGKITKNDNWLCELKKLPTVERIVMIEDTQCKEHIFSVTPTFFEEDLFIVSLLDISDTMNEKFELKEKSIHDTLTNAYNREYFDQNYQQLISQAYNKNTQLGLAILDIDFFKKVNDTFGHDIGDYVLVELVKTINTFSRSEDILIRWGGEEFLMIFHIDSYEALLTVLNNIRKMIKNHFFKEVEHLTVSIGATLYVKNESIENTIKRADKGLYESKNNGRNKVTLK